MAICKCSFMKCKFFPLHLIVISSANKWAFIGGLMVMSLIPVLLRLMIMSLIPIKK